ncbi:MAG: 1-acyl-sn-glycerol-3-phosphate acyltransferase [Smithella sp.]
MDTQGVRMSILGEIKSWTTQIGEHYAGTLYRQDNYPLNCLVRQALSKVKIADETVCTLKQLSEKGTVIYALKDRSHLDTLIIRQIAMRREVPRPQYAHGLNMIVWQPFSQALKVLLSSFYNLVFKGTIGNSRQTQYLKRITLQKINSIIHVGGSEFHEDALTENAIRQLIDAQEASPEPIMIVPMMVTYGRRREKDDESPLNILFGQSENIGELRRLITFLRYANRDAVITAEPVDLADFLKNRQKMEPEQIHRELRRELIERIDDEKISIVGPVLKSREEMIETILKDPKLIEVIDELSTSEKKDHKAIAKRAKKYLREIAADYNEAYIEFLVFVLTWVWNNIYDGIIIDPEGLKKIRNISKKMPIVLIPCHRSHIDYLLLSQTFYCNNLQVPFIAAGNNLTFWPMGRIFRKSGAFFMRRTFKGNVLYGEVFAQYIKALIKEGMPIEFFIEGGRSRTGKMAMPKYGLLSMVIQAFLEKAADDLALVPIVIGYDRVIEEKSYMEELEGASKKKEKTTDLIKSSKVLRKRYGRVYLNVGEPLLLKSYLAAQGKPYETFTVEERQSLYRKIGYEIVLEINKVSVVTPFSLVAAGLLSHARRGISREDLRSIVALFVDYLSYNEVRLATTFGEHNKAITDAIGLYIEANLIAPIGTGAEEDELEEVVYSLSEDKRPTIEYYKNNILHFFLPISFVAMSILARGDDMIDMEYILAEYKDFKRFFKHEFIFDFNKDDRREIEGVLDYLSSRDMAAQVRTGEDGKTTHIEVKGKGRERLRHFAGLVHNYIESYWVTIRGCSYLRKGPLPEKDFVKRIREIGVKMYNKGEIQRAESLSQPNYMNALRCLEEMEAIAITEVMEKGGKRPTKSYRLNERRDQIDRLRRHLFKYL